MSNYKSYFLKSLGLKEDSLPGGKGDETTPMSVSPEQLQMGIKTEMEHTHDPSLAKEIALDHLTEDPEYYSHLKDAGMADELPNGQQPSQGPMMMNKLMAPKHHPSVIAIAVRGSKTGGLPSGGQFNDSEKARNGGLETMKVLPQGGVIDTSDRARLGGLERVTNLKANSQGAISDTPASDDIKADGGHYTPDNGEITGTDSPKTSCEGDDAIHPMQVQQIGNEPITDDGTTRDGETSPEAAVAGIEGGEAPESEVEDHPASDFVSGDRDDQPAEEPTNMAPEKDDEKGVWGIPMDKEDNDEEEEEEDKKGKDVAIDIKEGKKIHEGWVMGEYTPEQKNSLKILSKNGFREVSTFPDNPDAEGMGETPQVIIVVQKKSRVGRTQGEISPDGLVNGQDVQQFVSGTMMECQPCGCEERNARFKKLANIKEDGEMSDYDRGAAETDSSDYKRCKTCGKQGYLCKCNDVGTGRSPSKWEKEAMKDPDVGPRDFDIGPLEGTGEMSDYARCKTCGFRTCQCDPALKEAGALSEKHDQLRAMVDKMKLQGKTSPAMQKAEQYLAEYDRPEAADVMQTDTQSVVHGAGDMQESDLNKMIQDFISVRNPDDKPEDIAELIVAQAQDIGMKGVEGKFDYILSQVTKYWK